MDKKEEGSLLLQLDSLADDPHKLCHSDVIRHQELALVNVRDLGLGRPLNNDLPENRMMF